jgi:predicted O-methyltransferase YrrM
MSTIQAPVFTQDWSNVRSYWPDMFQDLGLTGKPDLRFLEIGCYEGAATLWLLENVLTDPSSQITVIDTFEGSMEFDVLGIEVASRERFENNVAAHADQVVVCEGRSQDLLRAGWPTFDFIYIDGSHIAADVLADAVLAWPMLRQGGIMCFDDYAWSPDAPPHLTPKLGIEAFAAVYERQLRVLHVGWQFVVEKL